MLTIWSARDDMKTIFPNQMLLVHLSWYLLLCNYFELEDERVKDLPRFEGNENLVEINDDIRR